LEQLGAGDSADSLLHSHSEDGKRSRLEGAASGHEEAAEGDTEDSSDPVIGKEPHLDGGSTRPCSREEVGTLAIEGPLEAGEGPRRMVGGPADEDAAGRNTRSWGPSGERDIHSRSSARSCTTHWIGHPVVVGRALADRADLADRGRDIGHEWVVE